MLCNGRKFKLIVYINKYICFLSWVGIKNKPIITLQKTLILRQEYKNILAWNFLFPLSYLTCGQVTIQWSADNLQHSRCAEVYVNVWKSPVKFWELLYECTPIKKNQTKNNLIIKYKILQPVICAIVSNAGL